MYRTHAYGVNISELKKSSLQFGEKSNGNYNDPLLLKLLLKNLVFGARLRTVATTFLFLFLKLGTYTVLTYTVKNNIFVSKISLFLTGKP